MLRFAEQPDDVFRTILIEAIDEAINFIEAYGEYADSFRGAFTLAARHFTPLLASETLQRLRAASEGEELYQLTDYHWELLYDALENFSGLFNDNEVDSTVRSIYGIKNINFAAMIGKYFRGTDFRENSETILKFTEEQTQAVGFSQETFGLAQGFSAHSEELALRAVQQDVMEERKSESSPVHPVRPSSTYPY